MTRLCALLWLVSVVAGCSPDATRDPVRDETGILVWARPIVGCVRDVSPIVGDLVTDADGMRVDGRWVASPCVGPRRSRAPG